MHPDLDKIAEQIPAPRLEPDRWAHVKLSAMLVAGAAVYFLFDLGRQPLAVGLIPSPWDKVAHVILFGVFAFLGGFSASLFDLSQRWLLTLTFLAVLMLGAFDEWHQLSLPGRHAGWDDLACDALGALVGVLVLGVSGLTKGGKGPRGVIPGKAGG